MSETTKVIGVHTEAKRKDVFHTDKQCSFLTGEVRPLTDHEIEYHDLDECSQCSDDGEWRDDNEQDKSYYNALVEQAAINERE
ncbi:MAG: hypothetical protein J07AB43_02540 [Candidatus Nanosalina sp. J07AB43]|nr:MAG: hypothetical protein J07AB43_02540 [Candidatus Nanosalina sp. J07AB43]